MIRIDRNKHRYKKHKKNGQIRNHLCKKLCNNGRWSDHPATLDFRKQPCKT